MMSHALPKLTVYLEKAILLIGCLMPFLLVSRALADVGMSLAALFSVVLLLDVKSRAELLPADIKMALLLALYVFLMSLLFLPDTKAGLLWLRFPLAYAGLRYVIIKNPEYCSRIMIAALIASLLLLLDSYWQYFDGVSLSGNVYTQVRLTGPLSNYNIGNLVLKLFFPVFAFLQWFVFQKTGNRWRILPAIYGLLVFCFIPITGERSTTVLMLLSAFAYGGVYLLFKPRAWRWVIMTLTVLMVLFYALYSTQKVTQARTAEFQSNVSSFSGTLYGQLFKGGWVLFQRNPITGIGPSQYWTACAPLKVENIVTYCDMHPHNIYLQMLAETGLIGGIMLLGLALTCLFMWRSHKISQSGDKQYIYASALSGLLVLFFPVIVTQSFFSNWPASLFWFSLFLVMSVFSLHKDSYAA